LSQIATAASQYSSRIFTLRKKLRCRVPATKYDHPPFAESDVIEFILATASRNAGDPRSHSTVFSPFSQNSMCLPRDKIRA